MSHQELINADCLDVLASTPTASVDAVITDPPYGINTKSDGMGKLNPWADLMNAAHWYAAWMGHCRRIIKPTGCMWSFLNWRGQPTFMRAAADIGWPIDSLLVWDKKLLGTSGMRGLRPAYELIALWCGPAFSITDRSIRDIICVPWVSTKPTGHPAEKPERLIEWLIGASSLARGMKVLDPFAGSGTVGAACARAGLDYLGIEIDAHWAQFARQRITDAVAQQTLPHLDPPPPLA